MKTLISILLLITSSCFALDSTYRIKAFKKEGPVIYRSQGVAVHVDISSVGFKGNRYFLTCYHVHESYNEEIVVEIDGKDVPVKVIKYDEEFDISLLEAKEEITSKPIKISELVNEAKDLKAIGGPGNEEIISQKCTMKLCFTGMWLINIKKFANGSSGSAIISNGRLVGIAKAVPVLLGMEVQGEAVVLPIRRIRQFLRE